ncbi:uncharacterized protein DFL_000738 [Arthrobotrys flagrans]|uniref:Uncharacterized protein n=1 Tax=Arthrobotrys flagrans TaxID=97331 RepID=A0A437AEL3_ARTFL|nr:hypothetical protein DFL_000738 [Arthrobotrys flagrans]
MLASTGLCSSASVSLRHVHALYSVPSQLQGFILRSLDRSEKVNRDADNAMERMPASPKIAGQISYIDNSRQFIQPHEQ